MEKKQSTFRYLVKNRKLLGIYPLRDKSRKNLALLNYQIARIDDNDPQKEKRIAEYDMLMAHHFRGKWLATRSKEGQPCEWTAAYKAFKTSIKFSQKLKLLLDRHSAQPLDCPELTIEKRNEIEFANSVPLVPAITPVILLRGSSYEMGHQFATQLIQIFGEWILEIKKGIAKDNEPSKRWAEEHQKYTPEVIDFCHGWADAACENQIAQSYEDVLTLWVGNKEPASSYLNIRGGIPDLPPLACSAIAAWGKASEKGDLFVAASADHDMSFQVTIVAYPDDGIPFVFTIFEATGSLPTVGPNWFFGHPGMNREGLVYVHHGGGPKMLEPLESWGYGIRRGASVMHMLRYKHTIDEALAQEKEWPIGDIGNGDQATVGGFYADYTGAYIVESRKEPVIIRRSGVLKEKDYLFANNSVAHPDAVKSPWMSGAKEEWKWDDHGGWRPKTPRGMKKSFKLLIDYARGKLDTDMLMSQGMMFAYWNSYNRNTFFNEFAQKHLGKIDEKILEDLYSTGGTMPPGTWEEAVKNYKKNGSWGEISPAHSSNALVAILNPSQGLYRVCTGPVKMGLPPMSPDQAISVRGERNAFWDIRLKETPKALLHEAKKLAEDLLREVLDGKRGEEIPAGYIKTAEKLLVELGVLNQNAFPNDETDDINEMNSRLRQYTRIHVLARQYLRLKQ